MAGAQVATQETLAQICGRSVLFIGIEAHEWTVQQIAQKALWAHQQGVDTVAVKRADGGIKWYRDAAQLRAERAAVLAEGCGYLPFLYSYGPRFGDQQIRDECAILQEIGDNNDGVTTVDMEVEWNGQVQAADLFESIMRPWPGKLIVSTWADPLQQDWANVVKALAPCVDAWGPQQYDNWLDAQNQQLVNLGETVIFPELDLSQEFGPNDVLGNVRTALQRGQKSIWFWELALAERDPRLLRACIAEIVTQKPV